MTEKSDILQVDSERVPAERAAELHEALAALRRLREIGEGLPPVDAAAAVREGRDAAEQGSR